MFEQKWARPKHAPKLSLWSFALVVAMVGSGEVASEQAAAARGDDEPAPAEPETSGCDKLAMEPRLVGSGPSGTHCQRSGKQKELGCKLGKLQH